MVGNWRVDKADSATKLEIEWGAGRNFLISKCIVTRNGASQIDTQIIGFDPRSESIVSWHFDHNGGFGHGKWSKSTEGWQVDFAGVGADGSRTKASNIFVMKSPDEFSWHSIKQSVEDQALPDSDVLVLQKSK
jgi:hypothetical protein